MPFLAWYIWASSGAQTQWRLRSLRANQEDCVVSLFLLAQPFTGLWPSTEHTYDGRERDHSGPAVGHGSLSTCVRDRQLHGEDSSWGHSNTEQMEPEKKERCGYSSTHNLLYIVLSYHCYHYVTCHTNTVPWESIQTPWLVQHFVALQPCSKIDTIIFSPHQSTHNSPSWQRENRFLEMLANVLHFFYISIQTLCYETRKWAQVHPVSIDHPWDVSTTWLESTCGECNWLDMIWKGTHLSI